MTSNGFLFITESPPLRPLRDHLDLIKQKSGKESKAEDVLINSRLCDTAHLDFGTGTNMREGAYVWTFAKFLRDGKSGHGYYILIGR